MSGGFNRDQYLGIRHHCGICDIAYRRNEMVVQRGVLVCKETCIDAPGRTQGDKD